MARDSKAIVLDAWSILAYLEDEPAGSKVADAIADAHENGLPLLMTVVNLGEVWYILARATSADEAHRNVLELKQLGIDYVDVDWKLTEEAARFKSKYRMSFADCFAAALAKINGALLLTGDPEFKQIAREVKIGWLEKT